jgi:hypothetical protein
MSKPTIKQVAQIIYLEEMEMIKDWQDAKAYTQHLKGIKKLADRCNSSNELYGLLEEVGFTDYEDATNYLLSILIKDFK